jgi:hypothetical protein
MFMKFICPKREGFNESSFEIYIAVDKIVSVTPNRQNKKTSFLDLNQDCSLLVKGTALDIVKKIEKLRHSSLAVNKTKSK